MKTLFNIWASFAIAILIVAMAYVMTSCEESVAQQSEQTYEDSWCLAEGQGIVLQEIQFINGEPILCGEPVYLTDDAQNLINSIFNNETNIWQYPIAAVCWKTNFGGYVVDLD